MAYEFRMREIKVRNGNSGAVGHAENAQDRDHRLRGSASTVLKGHSGTELHIYFLVHLESIYYEIFFYSKIVPNCAVAK